MAGLLFLLNIDTAQLTHVYGQEFRIQETQWLEYIVGCSVWPILGTFKCIFALLHSIIGRGDGVLPGADSKSIVLIISDK